MSQVIAIGAQDEAAAKQAVIDLRGRFSNVRVIGMVDQVQANVAAGDKFLVIATDETFKLA